MKKVSALSRILAFALVVCMCAAFCATPMVASAEAVVATVKVTPTSGNAFTIAGDNVPVSVGDGTVTYNPETQTITLDGATAKKIQVTATGLDIAAITFNVIGTNEFANTSTQAIHLTNVKHAVFVGDGTLNVSGTSNLVFTSGRLTFDGPVVSVSGKGDSNTSRASIYSTFNSANNGDAPAIEILSGSVTATRDYDQAIYATAGHIVISGGTVSATTASGKHSAIRTAKNLTISDADVSVNCGGSAALNIAGDFTMNSGSLDLTAGENFLFNIVGDLTINGGEVTMNAENTNAALYSKTGNINLLGGNIIGSGKALFNLNTGGESQTIQIGAETKIDYTASVGMFYGQATVDSLVVDDGVVFAEGCDPRVDGTLTCRTVVGEVLGNAMINATATLNGANKAGLTIGLYDAEGALVDSKVTESDGAVTFYVNELPVGEYAFTLKQTALNNGIVYAADIPVSVIVDAAGNVTVTENLVFENTYDAENGVITMTLPGGSSALLTDVPGDETASFIDGVTFDTDTKVVTMTNVTATAVKFDIPSDFTVVFVGENVINTAASYSFQSVAADVAMTLTGEGSLTAGATGKDYAIHSAGDLNIEDTTVTIVDGRNYAMNVAGDLYVADSTVSVTGQARVFSVAGKITLANSDVTSIRRDNGTTYMNVVYGAGFEMNGGTLNIVNGENGLIGSGNVALNSGSLVSNAQKFITHNDAAGSSVEIYVGADMDIDATCPAGAIVVKNADVTATVVTAEGVYYEEGKALAQDSTAVKTTDVAPVPPVSAEANISATVTLDGAADAGRVVELWNEEGKIVDAIADEAGVVTFTVSELAAGEYTYILKVVGEDGNGVTFAEDATVTVTVVDNDNVTVAPEAIVLANAYDAEDTSATIEATVTLDGREIGYEEFYLILNGETLAEPLTALVGTDGKASFELPYSAEGTYTYVLSQQAVTLGGVTVDTETTYEITVTVVDNNGALEATVSEGTYTFANTYAVAENEANINANVTLADKTLNEGDFTFVLKEGDNEIATATNDAAGNVLFNIKYNTVGTKVYTYTLTQLDSAIEGVTEDTTEYTITVTVTDNGVGTLTVEVDPANVTFANTYKIPFVEGSIQEIDGELFYVSTEGVPTQMGLFLYEEDGCYYYAGATGRLVVSQTYYAPLVNENCLGMTDGVYYFNEYGQVVGANGGEIVDIDGALYYYEGGKPVYKGLFLYDGVYYYAGTAGQLLFDTSYYTWKVDASVTDLGPATYYFDSDCKLIGASAEGEIVEIDGVEYFFRSGKAVYAGLITVDGTVYYAGTEGKILKNRTYYVSRIDASAATIAAGTYTFGADGAMVGLSAEGEIVEIDGVDYFYRNGKAVYAGLITVDGTVYYAGTNGKILKNRTYYVSRIDASAASYAAGTYTFGADGKLV